MSLSRCALPFDVFSPVAVHLVPSLFLFVFLFSFSPPSGNVARIRSLAVPSPLEIARREVSQNSARVVKKTRNTFVSFNWCWECVSIECNQADPVCVAAWVIVAFVFEPPNNSYSLVYFSANCGGYCHDPTVVKSLYKSRGARSLCPPVANIDTSYMTPSGRHCQWRRPTVLAYTSGPGGAGFSGRESIGNNARYKREGAFLTHSCFIGTVDARVNPDVATPWRLGPFMSWEALGAKGWATNVSRSPLAQKERLVRRGISGAFRTICR